MPFLFVKRFLLWNIILLMVTTIPTEMQVLPCLLDQAADTQIVSDYVRYYLHQHT